MGYKGYFILIRVIVHEDSGTFINFYILKNINEMHKADI